MNAKTFLPWSLLVIVGTAVATYAVAHRADPEPPHTPTLPPSFLRAVGSPRPRDDTLVVHDLAALTPREAGWLDGKRARFRVAIDSPPSDRLGCVCYGCVTPDDMERTLFLRDGETDRDGLEVEAVLRVLHHPAAVCGGTAFTGFTEYRLVGAVHR